MLHSAGMPSLGKLRAVTRLSHLWHRQGKKERARQSMAGLTGVYGALCEIIRTLAKNHYTEWDKLAIITRFASPLSVFGRICGSGVERLGVSNHRPA